MSSDDCTKKVRILALTLLGNESNTFTYEKIANFLNVDVSEVEYWVISAVSANLIEVRMDQIHEEVSIR